MRPEDVAALFDLPPPTAEPQPAESTTDAEEAALAAELAAELASAGVAADAPDSRAGVRVDVSWSARMRLPDGRVIELEVRNVSQAGAGLMSGQPIPAHAVVGFEMRVPPLDEGGEAASVEGTIQTTYTVARGPEILCGGTWVDVRPADLELVDRWIERLRR